MEKELVEEEKVKDLEKDDKKGNISRNFKKDV